MPSDAVCFCYYLFVLAIKFVTSQTIVLSLNEAAVCKTNCHLPKFWKQSAHTPAHPCSHPIVLYCLKQQTTAPAIPRSVSDWGCTILSWHIVVFFLNVLTCLFTHSFFFLLVFVLCVFTDWCCDNYKDCAAGVPVSRKAHTEPLFSLDD